MSICAQSDVRFRLKKMHGNGNKQWFRRNLKAKENENKKRNRLYEWAFLIFYVFGSLTCLFRHQMLFDLCKLLSLCLARLIALALSTVGHLNWIVFHKAPLSYKHRRHHPSCFFARSLSPSLAVLSTSLLPSFAGCLTLISLVINFQRITHAFAYVCVYGSFCLFVCVYFVLWFLPLIDSYVFGAHTNTHTHTRTHLVYTIFVFYYVFVYKR